MIPPKKLEKFQNQEVLIPKCHTLLRNSDKKTMTIRQQQKDTDKNAISDRCRTVVLKVWDKIGCNWMVSGWGEV